MQARRTNIPNKLDIETEKWAQEDHEDELEIPISDKGSDQDNDKDSDLSFEPDDSRKRVVLSQSELNTGSPNLRFPLQDHLNKAKK